MAATPDAAAQTMINNLPEKTGKSLSQWHTLLAKSHLQKHGEMMKLLKTEHGVTHGFANLIVLKFRERQDGGASSADNLVETQYKGDKAGLRPIYEAIIKTVSAFGRDVEISPKKTYVSLRRKKQFALIQASTKERIDVGINLKGLAPDGRLEKSGSFNAMVTHRVRISNKKDVNSELKQWLQQAYEEA